MIATTSHDLDAAQIHDPYLRGAYASCRALHAAHGKTFYLATLLLPPAARPAVWALYGFARLADELVDHDRPLSTSESEAAASRLDALQAQLDGRGGDDAVAAAVVSALRHTLEHYDIDRATIPAFLDSMRMDLHTTEYRSYADLEVYMYGSAAVIGLQMLPVLGHPSVPASVVAPYAVDLGVAFQLTNFVRDVGEDLRRGRIYLPTEELSWFGVDRDHLRRGVVDGALRRALACQIARIRELYRSARAGIRLLDPVSRDCITVAATLYEGILDEVERSDYRVLDRRVRVSGPRRLRVALPGAARAVAARSELLRSIPRRPQ